MALRIQDSLNILAGTTGLRNQDCINILAGTTGRSQQDAFNIWAGTTGLSREDAANVKAGTTNLSLQDALDRLAAGPGGISTGLVMWVKADTGVYTDAGTTLATNGQTVQQWNDQTTGGLHFTQSTAGARPTYQTNQQNGLPGITFDNSGTADFMANASLVATTARTIFFVGKSTAAATGDEGFFGNHEDASVIDPSAFGTDGSWAYYGTSAFGYGFQTGTNIAPAIITLNYADVSNLTPRMSGVAVSTFNPIDAYSTTNGMGLGARNAAGSTPKDCQIYEFIVFNRSLTADEITSVESYLSSKWGIGIEAATTPLTKFTNFTRASNTATVGAGAALYDGWLDVVGSGFDINTGNLRQTLTNVQRLNILSRPTTETSTDQTIVVQFIQGTGFVIPWAKYNATNNSGYRAFINGTTLSIDKCVNGTLSDSAFGTGATYTAGTSYIMELRASPGVSGGTLLTVTTYTTANYQAIPRGAAMDTVTTTITDATIDGARPVGVSMSQFSTTQNTVQNLWVIDNTETQSGSVITVSNPSNLAYIGSSTWFNANGAGVYSGLKVPAIIESIFEATYSGSAITTQNGAVSGTTTADFLPGTANSNSIKASVQGASGYKVLRLMIGSNDASTGVTTAAWLNNMNLIIQDALTWTVDLIILEEIGVRTDGGATVLNLIADYNAKRGYLVGPKVKLGNAATFKNQSFTQNWLQGDFIHQTDDGSTYLAQEQTDEISTG